MASVARGYVVKVCSIPRNSCYQLLQCVKQSSSASSFSDIRMPGPDASVKDASYESREYFSHNDFTYYDEEFEINKLRLPQPSPVTKEES